MREKQETMRCWVGGELMVTDGLEEEKKQEETGGEGRNVGVQEDYTGKDIMMVEGREE